MTRGFASAATGLLALAALISCAPAPGRAGVAQPGPSMPASRALQLADALAQADAAASTGNDASLGQSLATIRALGAHPQDDAAQVAMSGWQDRAGDPGPPLRGRTLGPGYRHGTLNAGADLRIEQTFLSGQKATIALSSPDAAQLRLQVIDGASQPICQHTASRPSCEWVPMFTQRHMIHVINPGRRKARFYLVVD